MPRHLPSIGITELLEHDPRPTFVVERPLGTDDHVPSVVYTNPAMSRHKDLSQIITTYKGHEEGLWPWIRNTQPGDAPELASTQYMGLWWTRTFLMKKFIVVGANYQPQSSQPSIALPNQGQSQPLPEDRASNTRGTSTSTHPIHDSEDELGPATRALRRVSTDLSWTIPDFMPEEELYGDVINSTDWENTPLGPKDKWSTRLQQMVAQILADSRPMSLYWGPEYTTIYNEAFSRLCGTKHPWLLGKPVAAAWPGAGHRLVETMQASAKKQRASVEDEWKFFIEKPDGSLEETYLKWSIIPIIENGTTLGFMHPVLETSSMRLWERRMKMLIDLGDALVSARDVKSYWQKAIEELGRVEPRYDIPFAVIYSIQDEPDASDYGMSYPDNKMCHLEGGLGVPVHHPIGQQTLFLRKNDSALAGMFKEALKVQTPTLLETRDGTLPEELLEGIEWRGFGDPCRAAVICPIRPTKEEDVMGILLLGLNPRRNFDHGYRQYLELLSQKLTTTLASTVLLEEEARRGRNAAAQADFDREELKERLAFQTKEATESIQKFQTVAEFVPVGMSFGDLQGNINFANDAWYRITGHPYDHGEAAASAFMACVLEEDRDSIVEAYEKLKTMRNVTFEFRVKRQTPTDSSGSPAKESPGFQKAGLDLVGIGASATEKHILASARAERGADGGIIRVLTCLTDVTLHKRTAEEAVRRAQQAENLKRMAEYATVGMYEMDIEGRLLDANKVFYDMCGLERVDPSQVVIKPWEKCIAKEDIDLLKRVMSKLVTGGQSQKAELRFNTPWNAVDRAGNQISTPRRWVDATFLPVKTPDGVVQSFTGCLSDVSLQKWQLESERQRKEEAIESKRQQENFIDMTSHEMRNPLSAIIHCADAVIASLSKVQELTQTRQQAVKSASQSDNSTALARSDTFGSSKHGNSNHLAKTEHLGNSDPSASAAQEDSFSKADQLIMNSIDNTETIIACTQHQRRVVDDILTMSKFDAHLLILTPITCDPVLIAEEAIKMFEVEARRVDIDLGMVVDESYRDLGVGFLDFDPSRVKQILINLLTNALKFTKSGAIRNVSVTLSISTKRPTAATSSVEFIPRPDASSTSPPPASTPAPHDGRTEPLYLLFEVRDTGQGLTEDEIESLFQRFVQASSRTHVKYGGSGLGLFISRRLTEMQGGAIGVASRPGVGSTFAFYIETFRPEPAALKEAQAAAAATRSVLAAVTNIGSMAGSDGRDAAPGTAAPLSAQQTGGEVPEIEGILIVEDNLINQQITRKGLLDRGYTVYVANHGLEALEQLSLSDRSVGPVRPGSQPAGFPLSVILMDLEMPVQDGLTCTRQIRELEKEGKIGVPDGRGGFMGRGRIPIIAVSANARMEQILEARAAGCDDVLVKPYRMPELIEKMQVVMRRVWEGLSEEK